MATRVSTSPVLPPPAPRRTVAAAPAPAPAAPRDLKYLAFFRTAVIEIFLFIVQIYNQLKVKSGSLKPGIDSVEHSVKNVVGPAIAKFNIQPAALDDYLVFLDGKVDETLQFAQDHTPNEWQHSASSVYKFLSEVPEKVHAAVEEYNKNGAAATARSYYDSILPVILAYLEAVWKFFLALPFVPQLVNTAQPYGVFFAQKYNHIVAEASKSDIGLVKTASGYLPTIPVEKLTKVE